ncbi:TOTE conflict system archaeo-eukaryotic primase domain-containing protein [Caldinitratiruptor microaerophilus]|nr:hypothetical protein [Caldinitratiruptor microaerophilus]
MQLALPLPPVPVPAAATAAPSTPDEKIALFRSLFRGREDVYAVRWEAKNGRSGYSPVCANEWAPGICFKPKVKCAECPHRAFRRLTDEVVRDHLTGRYAVGIYPLLTDETCWFLAADFDKTTWLEDAVAFLRTCDDPGGGGAGPCF